MILFSQPFSLVHLHFEDKKSKFSFKDVHGLNILLGKCCFNSNKYHLKFSKPNFWVEYTDYTMAITNLFLPTCKPQKLAAATKNILFTMANLTWYLNVQYPFSISRLTSINHFTHPLLQAIFRNLKKTKFFPPS